MSSGGRIAAGANLIHTLGDEPQSHPRSNIAMLVPRSSPVAAAHLILCLYAAIVGGDEDICIPRSSDMPPYLNSVEIFGRCLYTESVCQLI